MSHAFSGEIPDNRNPSPLSQEIIAPGFCRFYCPSAGITGKRSRKRADQVTDMKTTLYDGSRRTTVNTRHDECLYHAPRPVRGGPEVTATGKDLYMHVQTDQEKKITYYLHLWSKGKAIGEKILPLSQTMAERFLKQRGLDCNLFPRDDPVSRLYAWGYGIAEEF